MSKDTRFPDLGRSTAHAARSRFSRLRTALLVSAVCAGLGGLGVVASGVGSSWPVAGGSMAAYGAEQAQVPDGFADLVAKVKPAVISVRVKMDQSAAIDDDSELPIRPQSPEQKFFSPFGQNQKEHQPRETLFGEGSGFFVSSDGYAVTNYHVVDHAKSVRVTTDDGTIHSAKVIGTDAKSDLALLKIDGKKDFPFVKFAEQEPRAGQWVVTVGNPFGLGGTVTAGIVSARGREIGGVADDFLQIDAPINKGNSGGPAFNMNGDVIGVNTAIFSPSGGSVGIGFDVPADTAKMVIWQLKDKGRVTRGWLGVEVQPVTPSIAESLGLKEAKGALVDEPSPGSPAAQAGIMVGDVITDLNGTPIKDARTLAQRVALQPPGSSMKVTILRNSETKTVDLKLAEMPNQDEGNGQQPEQKQSQLQQKPMVEPRLGLSLAPAHQVGGSGEKGVVVLGVDPDSPAAENGVQSGDVILNVGGKSVDDPSQVRQAVDQTRSQGKHAVLMRVQTAQGTRFIAVPLGEG